MVFAEGGVGDVFLQVEEFLDVFDFDGSEGRYGEGGGKVTEDLGILGDGGRGVTRSLGVEEIALDEGIEGDGAGGFFGHGCGLR